MVTSRPWTFSPMRVLAPCFCSLLLLTGSLGCGPSVRHYVLVDAKQSQQKFEEADAVIEKHQSSYGKRNAVLYDLDRGMMLHLAGRYRDSNRYLLQAEDRIDALYTRSVTAGAGAMLTNDNTLPYEGEDFEKVMINIIAALNFVRLGEWDEALVEARKVDHKLNLLNDRYEKKNVYKRDALAQYLSGILYEGRRELNDAFISYRKAHEAYQDYEKSYGTPVPPLLASDLLRVTEALGLPEEHEGYLKQFSGTTWMSDRDLRARGEVIFISYAGHAPLKEDFFITASIPDGQGGTYLLRVAMPKFAPRPNRVRTTEVHLIPGDGGGTGSGGSISQRPFLAEDITAIARKSLEDRVGRITAKAIARATTKYIIARVIRKGVDRKTEENPVAGFLTDLGTNLYSVLSEQSDKRSWRTLPDEIRMARLVALPGIYTVAVEYYDHTGGLISRETFGPFELKAGEKKFLDYRIF